MKIEALTGRNHTVCCRQMTLAGLKENYRIGIRKIRQNQFREILTSAVQV